MTLPKDLLDALITAWPRENESFIIGKESFSDLEINATPDKAQFYYFYDKKNHHLVKQFILQTTKNTDYVCEVILIKKEGRFTPRLIFSIRDKNKKLIENIEVQPTNIKSRIGLDKCHENFWKLIRYIDSIKEIEIPKESFSLMSQSEGEIVSALQGRDPESILSIIKGLSSTEGIKLSKEDIDQLLKRKEKLDTFKKALGDSKNSEEKRWQNFFEKNKWIFGYGLNYQILRQEQDQPNYGGTKVDGTGGQRGDYLTSTMGDINFTVLVEIKTPVTKLLQGSKEIRNGAWSLSKELVDAISQIEANISTWDKSGSIQNDNKDELEGKEVYTVQPKGIIVIGLLSELDTRNKRETFQRFRKSIHGVDILTFDELYNRAKFIVESKEEN